MAALEYAQNQDSMIRDATPVSDSLGERAEPPDTDRQFYATLTQLCNRDTVDLHTKNTTASWRAWTRLFDPQGAGRRRHVVSMLLQPGSFDPPRTQQCGSEVGRESPDLREAIRDAAA